ncbi:MAG: class I SAM-dependent methyltransferase [Gemmataceae bacterium]
MQNDLPGTLKSWEGWAGSLTPLAGASSGLTLIRVPAAREYATYLYACEAMEPASVRPDRSEEIQPYTLQWFLDIENQRHSRHARWIPRLLEFGKHAGETLLGLGEGLGTDWLQYARHGASVVVCSPEAEQLGLIRRNFELRGLQGRFIHASADCLPLENGTIDVACVSGLLDQVAQPQPIVEEIYRVLKPGGKVLAVTPAKYDVKYWEKKLFPWKRWLESGPVEEASQPAKRFSGRRLAQLFSPFSDHRVYKRHLRRSLVPRAWRWLPLSLLERLIGQELVLKAFKPISAAMTHQRLAA